MRSSVVSGFFYPSLPYLFLPSKFPTSMNHSQHLYIRKTKRKRWKKRKNLTYACYSARFSPSTPSLLFCVFEMLWLSTVDSDQCGFEMLVQKRLWFWCGSVSVFCCAVCVCVLCRVRLCVVLGLKSGVVRHWLRGVAWIRLLCNEFVHCYCWILMMFFVDFRTGFLLLFRSEAGYVWEIFPPTVVLITGFDCGCFGRFAMWICEFPASPWLFVCCCFYSLRVCYDWAGNWLDLNE